MSIIDSSYFTKGILYIPNNTDLNAEPTGSPTNQTDLDYFISQYERNFLINALGITLYEELQTALPNLEQETNRKWKNLVQGVTYDNSSGVKKRYDGLLGYEKNSVIAAYVFTEYLRDNNEQYTTTGIVKNVAKNAENANPTPKFIKAYRTFLNDYQGDNTLNPEVYLNQFGTVGVDWYVDENTKVSLYQFLNESNEIEANSYPDFKFRFYEAINSFGI